MEGILLKVIAVGVVASAAALHLKSDRPELAFAVVLAAGVLGFSLLLSEVGEVVSVFSEVAASTGMQGSVYTSILKMIGIGYLTEIAAETVADFGSQSLATKITLAGKLSVFLLAMPIFKNLLTVVSELL